jgi:hypothetical protein
MRNPGNPDKSFSQIKKDQMGRENDLLNHLMGSKDEISQLTGYEDDLGVRRNEILFKVTSDIEDTKNALREAEGLVARLKNHLAQLEGMYRILTKGKK